jgi:hypothetical protein
LYPHEIIAACLGIADITIRDLVANSADPASELANQQYALKVCERLKRAALTTKDIDSTTVM